MVKWSIRHGVHIVSQDHSSSNFQTSSSNVHQSNCFFSLSFFPPQLPPAIRLAKPLEMDAPMSESEALGALKVTEEIQHSLIDWLMKMSVYLYSMMANVCCKDLCLAPFNFLTSFLMYFIHQKIMSKNKVCKSFIGLGYYETLTPGVILRNVRTLPVLL